MEKSEKDPRIEIVKRLSRALDGYYVRGFRLSDIEINEGYIQFTDGAYHILAQRPGEVEIKIRLKVHE